MAKSSEDVIGLARLAEGRLYDSLSHEKIDPVTVSENLEQYCKSGLDVIFNDYPTELANEVEEKLWAAHSKVNNHFRRTISKLQRNKNRVVETRKVLKRYLEFLKTSQRFYRAYILRLDHSYGGIAELRQIAKNWVSTNSSLNIAKLTPDVKQLVLRSCFRSLVHLGDLCRYREIEINKGQRNWGPAIGYYSLANDVLPESGIAHNQLAVVALADGNHLRAVYYLFRSLAARNPHPSAQSNLELEFKKVITAWDKGERIVKKPHGKDHASGRSLIAWFVRLHSKCYKGQDFPEHAELIQEVISQLEREITDRSINGKLQMLVLVNIAAEYFAAYKLQQGLQTEESYKSYLFYLEINVKTFRSLLSLLLDELQDFVPNRSEEEALTELAVTDRLTLVTKILLPVLRIYSTWLTINWALFAAERAEVVLNSHIHELWSTYTQVLSLLASIFPTNHLPTVNYMLEEDVDTIGFMPLVVEKTMKKWRNDNTYKSKFSDREVERLPSDIEMLGRIRELLVDGAQIVDQKDSPLTLQHMEFVYERKPNVSKFSLSDQLHASSPTPNTMQSCRELRAQDYGQLPGDVVANTDFNKISSTPLTTDVAMSRMVDDLVGPSNNLDPFTESESAVPPTPPEQTFKDTALINGITFGMSQLSTLTPNDRASKVSQLQKADTQFGSSISQAGMSSPPIRTLAALPPLLDQSGIWNSKAELTAPSSPFLDAAGVATQSSQSPIYLGGGSPTHSRNPSLTSIGSGQYAASGAWSPLLSIPIMNTTDQHQSHPPGNNVLLNFPNKLRSSDSRHSLTDLKESCNAQYYPNQNQMQSDHENLGFASCASGNSPYASIHATPGAFHERAPERQPSSPYVAVAATESSDFSPWNVGSDLRRGGQKSLLGRHSVAYRQEG